MTGATGGGGEEGARGERGRVRGVSYRDCDW